MTIVVRRRIELYEKFIVVVRMMLLVSREGKKKRCMFFQLVFVKLRAVEDSKITGKRKKEQVVNVCYKNSPSL